MWRSFFSFLHIHGTQTNHHELSRPRVIIVMSGLFLVFLALLFTSLLHQA